MNQNWAKQGVVRYRKKTLDIGVYMMASIIPMVFSVIINPIMALNMSPADYAIVGYYNAFGSLITPLVNFYLIHYYTRRFFKSTSKERVELKAVLLKTLTVFSILISLFVILALYAYMFFFNEKSEIPFWPFATLSVIGVSLTGIHTLILVDYRMVRNSFAFFCFSVGSGVSTILLTLIFVVVLKHGAFGKLLSGLISNAIFSILCILLNRKLLKIKFNFKIFIEAIKFCWPLVIAAMLSFFVDGYDRIALERNGNITELGYYVVGAQIAGYIKVFSMSIDNTFQADIFQSISEKRIRKTAIIIGTKILLILSIVIAFVTFAPYLIDFLTSGRYVKSTKYFVILSFSAISSMLYHSFSQVTIALGYTNITLINKVVGSVLCISMYTVFISKWGAIGAAYGAVISFILLFIGNFIFVSVKYYNDQRMRIVQS